MLACQSDLVETRCFFGSCKISIEWSAQTRLLARPSSTTLRPHAPDVCMVSHRIHRVPHLWREQVPEQECWGNLQRTRSCYCIDDRGSFHAVPISFYVDSTLTVAA